MQSKKSKRATVRKGISFFLLGLYCLGVFAGDFHELLDHDQDHSDTVCEESSKEDACHLAIYHGESEDKCDHELHVYSLATDCELCDTLLSKKESPILHSEEEKFRHFSIGTTVFIADQQQENQVFLLFLRRGPPAFSFS